MVIRGKSRRFLHVYRTPVFRWTPFIGVSFAWAEAWWTGLGFNAVLHWRGSR
jgi:hypothetical protein